MPQGALLRRAVVFYLLMGAAAAAFIGWRAGPSVLRARLIGGSPLVDVGIGALAGLLVVAASGALSGLSSMQRLEARLAAMLGRLRLRDCLLLAAISGLGEEMAFRAALQPEIGLVPAAAAFAVVHAPLHRDLLAWPFLAAAAGLVLGSLYLMTGAVLAPAMAHAVVNAIGLYRLSRRPVASSPDQGQAGTPEGLSTPNESRPNDETTPSQPTDTAR